jgi:hypothetical protein
LDETLFARVGKFRTQLWSTQIVDVRRGQLLDVVPGRDSVEPCRWLAARDPAWLAAIEWATLDLSASYRTVFDTMLPDAVQVADPFHVVKLANTALDECRRRVQNETLGHRGRRDDPLWRARRRLTIARERLSPDQHDKLMGLLRAGDPHREVWFAWNANYPALGGWGQEVGLGVRWCWWCSRLSMTRWWRAVSEVQPRWWASSRSWRMSSSWAVMAGRKQKRPGFRRGSVVCVYAWSAEMV